MDIRLQKMATFAASPKGRERITMALTSANEEGRITDSCNLERWI